MTPGSTTAPITTETKSPTEPVKTAETGADKSLLNQGEKAPEKIEPKPGEAKKPEAATGAPEKYEAFKVPEGWELDPKVSDEASTLFKELGLPQTEAQKLIDFHVAKTQEAAQAPYKAWETMKEAWLTNAKADPEIGGKLDAIKVNVGKALDTLGDPKLTAAFREVMDTTAVGNHPAFIKVLNRFAEAVVEGRPVRAGGPVEVKQPGQQRSLAQAMYPNNP